MKFKVNTSKEAVAESSGSSYISKSGIYDVVIKFASVEVTANGAESVNFNVEYNGNTQVIYGPYVTSKSGDPIEIGMKFINKLAILSGMEAGQELEFDTETHKVGKEGKPKEFTVITNFSDLPVKLRLQEEYSLFNGEIKSRLVPRNVFSADGASAEEIVNGTPAGEQLAKDEKYASNVTYKDELTPEAVEEWKKDRANNKPSATPTPAASSQSKKPVF